MTFSMTKLVQGLNLPENLTEPVRQALWSAFREGVAEMLPYEGFADEVQVILEMPDEELGEYNEWGDVERISLIRMAVKQLEEEKETV